MRTITVQQRRRAMVRGHRLAGDASDPEAATRAVVALHATDPASVYLSVLARSAATTLGDVAEAMYARRSLVRWMAMRRTLFVFAREDIALVQAAVSTPLAETLRRALVSRLRRNGSEPPIDGDIGRWVAGLEDRVERALARRGSASGAQLASDEPALATLMLAEAPSDRPQTLEEIVFQAGRDALADQDAVVAGIRQRTGTLLAAHALIASVLGATTVKAKGLHGFSWAALVALVLGLIVAAVLLSNCKLRFAIDAPDFYAELYDEAASEAETDTLGWLVSAAYGYHHLRRANTTRVRIMGGLLTVLGVLMVLQTLFWLIALR